MAKYRALKLLTVHGTPAFSPGELVPAEHVEKFGYSVRQSDTTDGDHDVEELADDAPAVPEAPAALEAPEHADVLTSGSAPDAGDPGKLPSE